MEVRFNPKVVSYETLAHHARRRRCASPVFVSGPSQEKIARQLGATVKPRGRAAIRWVKDNKYYLSQGPLKYLPMTATQATRINAKVSQATHWLSPRQKKLLQTIRQHPEAPWPSAIGVPFQKAWQRAAKVAAGI